MRNQAILFDLDDTLHDKAASLRRFAAMQYAAHGLRAHGVNAHAWAGAYLRLNQLRIDKTEVFDRLRRQFALPPERADILREEFDARLGACAVPYAGAVELVRACRTRGIKTGLVTNGRDAFQRSKIAGMGLAHDFDAVVTSGGVGIKKPDPRIFHACLDLLGVEPRAAAFVGDDFDADMQPCLALGMLAIWKSTATSGCVAFASDDLRAIQAFLLPAA